MSIPNFFWVSVEWEGIGCSSSFDTLEEVVEELKTLDWNNIKYVKIKKENNEYLK